jgi:hypothetical protein
MLYLPFAETFLLGDTEKTPEYKDAVYFKDLLARPITRKQPDTMTTYKVWSSQQSIEVFSKENNYWQ